MATVVPEPVALDLAVPRSGATGFPRPVAVVASLGGIAEAANVATLLTQLGYSPSLVNEATVTAGSLDGLGVIVLVRNANANATLAGHLEGYMADEGMPIIVCYTPVEALPVPTSDGLAALLGLVANQQDDTGGGPGSTVELSGDFQAEPITAGFRASDPLALYQADTGMNTPASEKTEHAGTALVLAENGLPCLVAANEGAPRIRQVGGTFPVRVVYGGLFDGAQAFARDVRVLLDACVRWCYGDYEVGEFPPLRWPVPAMAPPVVVPEPAVVLS